MVTIRKAEKTDKSAIWQMIKTVIGGGYGLTNAYIMYRKL